MLPFGDVIKPRTTAWVTIGLIVVDTLVFIYEQLLPVPVRLDLILAHAVVPDRLSWVSIWTSLLFHQGWLHLLPNMLALWLFGDNLEDRMGHGRFVVFLALIAMLSALTGIWAAPRSAVPVVGVTSVAAGVMGAYFALFPYSRLLVWIPLIVTYEVVEAPALFFVGVWFLLEAIGGMGELRSMGGSPYALWAPIAGLVTGAVSVWVFRRRERQAVEWWGA